MGGAVQSVTKPISKAVRQVTDATGVTERRQTQQQASAVAPQPAAAPMDSTAAREAGEERAARRRVRRGGQRALLSEARINPEQGVSTLGQTGL